MFKKFKRLLKEYNLENNTNISICEFFRVLNYSEEDITFILKNLGKKKERPKKVFSIRPNLPNFIGDRSNPEYEKYYELVCEYRKYSVEIGKISLKNFFKTVYNLSEENALNECKKIQNIVYVH